MAQNNVPIRTADGVGFGVRYDVEIECRGAPIPMQGFSRKLVRGAYYVLRRVGIESSRLHKYGWRPGDVKWTESATGERRL